MCVLHVVFSGKFEYCGLFFTKMLKISSSCRVLLIIIHCKPNPTWINATQGNSAKRVINILLVTFFRCSLNVRKQNLLLKHDFISFSLKIWNKRQEDSFEFFSLNLLWSNKYCFVQWNKCTLFIIRVKNFPKNLQHLSSFVYFGVVWTILKNPWRFDTKGEKTSENMLFVQFDTINLMVSTEASWWNNLNLEELCISSIWYNYFVQRHCTHML